MSESQSPEFGINSWLEDELYQEYLHDRRTVDESWKKVFESGGESPAPGNGGQSGHPVSVMNGGRKRFRHRFLNIETSPGRPWFLCAARPPGWPRT